MTDPGYPDLYPGELDAIEAEDRGDWRHVGYVIEKPRVRLYIAGPMTGYPDFNYPAFHAAEETLTAAGYDVFNPAHTEKENTTDAPQEWGWYMRRAIALLVQADGIALLPGWDQSRGARIEEELAAHLGMVRTGVEDWAAGVQRLGQDDPLHTPDHADMIDQGGYCNALVAYEDDAEACGYRAALPLPKELQR